MKIVAEVGIIDTDVVTQAGLAHPMIENHVAADPTGQPLTTVRIGHPGTNNVPPQDHQQIHSLE